MRKFEKQGRWRAAKTMISQFASHEVAEFPVELEIARAGGESRRHQGLTDKEGFVHFDIRLDPDWDYDAHPAWETVVFHWQVGDENQCLDAHVLAPGTDTGLGVISDIDDTIVETGITGDFRKVMRNWRRVLMQMPEERILVPGADVFYNALGGGEVLAKGTGHAGDRQPATHRPFFYVSSSPWNLFSYLVTYIRGRGLPAGPDRAARLGAQSRDLRFSEPRRAQAHRDRGHPGDLSGNEVRAYRRRQPGRSDRLRRDRARQPRAGCVRSSFARWARR